MKALIAWDRMAALLEKHRAGLPGVRELRIVGVGDAAEIVALHRELRASLLILDTSMPGPSPEEICRRVRADAELRAVSLIVIGSTATAEDVARCAANRSFLRPLDQADFLGAVRLLVDVAARKDYRVLLSVHLKGTVRSTPFFGRSENISATGILFSTNHALAVGDMLELTLVLPGQGQLHTKAEVVRAAGAAGPGGRFGARFIDPARAAFRMIEAFIGRKHG